MKIKAISTLAIFILLIAGISCKRNVSPFIPEIDTAEQTGKARLVGNIVLTGSNIKDFGSINIGIRGTNLRAHPDKNGNFRIDNLPLGDILVDVDVRNTLSYIPINNVTSNDEISLEIGLQGNDKAFFFEGRKNKDSKKELQVTIQPDEWNTSWVDSDKYVTAKISGKEFDDIVAESVQMVGPGGTAIAPASSEVGKKSLEAKFLRSAAIGIISNPVVGQSYVINITGEFDDETVMTLNDRIVIEEEEESDELELGIKPDEWNTSWVDSDEYVTAKISGKGFDSIVATTVQMVGPGGTGIAPASSELGDKSLEAKFLRSAAIGLITDPMAGESYEIQVTGELSGGAPFTLIDTITIVEELELGLGIKPDEWDTSWVDSDEYVTTKISGKGFDSIVATTVQMVGPDGIAIMPESSELGDKSLEAIFLRSAAIGIISNPVVDQSYEIQVTGELSGGTAFTLTDTITIVEELELDLGIKPDEWKTSWVNSTGDVTAKISGKGFDRIVASTVQMVGPGGTAITPESSELGDKSLEAKFLRSAAIGIISNPVAGQSYEIQVTGELSGGTAFTLTATITIEEEDDDDEEEGELALTIDPEKWNTNWEDSKGLVTARIKGKGFRDIDGDSVLMVGPDGDVITPYSYKVTGNSFMAKFRKQDAIGTITDPESGEEYVIQVTGTLSAGSQFSLEYEIKIVGSKK